MGGVNFYSYVKGRPVNATDPSGMFLLDNHYGLTFMAAREAGLSLLDADKLATATAWVDFRSSGAVNPAKNLQDPENSIMHAMSSPQHQVTQAEFDAFIQGLISSGDPRDLAVALHAMQDHFASGHRDFRVWPGGCPTVGHLVGDEFLSTESIGDAIATFQKVISVSADLIRAARR